MFSKRGFMLRPHRGPMEFWLLYESPFPGLGSWVKVCGVQRFEFGGFSVGIVGALGPTIPQGS